MDFDILVSFLRSDGSIIVNKRLAKAIGIDAAIMYSELLSKYIYFKERDRLTTEGFFFNTVENMEEDTTLSKYQQTKALKVLSGFGLVEQFSRGAPPIRHFKVIPDVQRVCKLLEAVEIHKKSKNQPFESQNNERSKGKKVDTNNTKRKNTNTNNNKDIYIIGDDERIDLFLKVYQDVMGKPHRTVYNAHDIDAFDDLLDIEEAAREHITEHMHDESKCTLEYFCKVIDRYR